MKHSPVDSRLRAYLLGELAEADRNAMETDIFTDKERFYRLSEIEDRLIDDYARGRLSSEEKLKFEQIYLTNPARRQRVEFALTMTRELDRQAEGSQPAANVELAAATGFVSRGESRSWWQAFLESLREPKLAWAVATASLALLVAGGAWLVAERARLQSQLDRARLENETAAQRQRELESQLAAAQISNGGQLASASPTPTSPTSMEKPPNAASAVFAFTLNIISLRSETDASANRITLPAGTEALRLRLPLAKNDFPHYQISLRDGSNREIFRARKLKASVSANEMAIFINIPALQLSKGDYLLTLEGISGSGEIEPIGKKQFSIEVR